jgi:hypothetical protein
MRGKIIAKTNIIDSTDPPFLWVRDPDGDGEIVFPEELANVEKLILRLYRMGAIEYVRPVQKRRKTKKELDDGKN